MSLVHVAILSFLEFCATMIIWSGIDNRINIKKSYSMIVILIGTMEMILINFFDITYNIKILVVLSIIAFVAILFKIPFWDSLIGFTVPMIFVPVIQMIIAIMFNLTGNDYISNFKHNLIMSVFTVIISILIYYLIPLNKYMNVLFNNKNYIFILILNIFLMISITVFLMDNEREFFFKYIEIFLIVVVSWNIINIVLMYQIINLKEKGKVIKVHEEYIGVIEKLIDDIRSRQHDFNNHIQIIGGIVEKNDDTHIKEALTDYLGGLNYSLKGINGLLEIKDNLLSALVYGKMEVARLNNIHLSVKYLNGYEGYPLKGYELVEVLGNLLDNSLEAILNSGETDDRKVILTIGTEEGKKVLQVENTGEKIESNDLDKIFDKGFSTKGNSRGYGLYNVKKSIDKYGGKILLPMNNQFTTIKILF